MSKPVIVTSKAKLLEVIEKDEKNIVWIDHKKKLDIEHCLYIFRKHKDKHKWCKCPWCQRARHVLRNPQIILNSELSKILNTFRQKSLTFIFTLPRM